MAIRYISPDVRYMPSVNYMPDVAYMPSVKYMDDVQYMPSVTYGTVTGVLNRTPYSSATNAKKEDVTEKIDSLADIIFPWSKDARDELLDETPWLQWYSRSDLLQSIPALKYALDYTFAPAVIAYNNMVEPIVRAIEDPDMTIAKAGLEIALNTANELGEDADILANIVKSQVPSAGGEAGSLETLAQSVGFGGPRKKYNYELGDSFGDSVAEIVLEVISDPMTWISLIISGVGAAEKASLSAAVKTTVEEVGEDLTDDVVEQATRIVTDKLTGELKDDVYNKIVQTVSDNTRQAIIDAAAKVSLSEAYASFATTTKALNTIKAVDKYFNIAGQWMTPIGPLSLAYQKAIAPMISTVYNHITRRLATVDLEKMFIKHAKPLYTDIVGSSFALNNDLLSSQEDLRRFITRTLRSDVINEQYNIYEILLSNRNNLDNLDLYESYIDYLLKHNRNFKETIEQLGEKALEELKTDSKMKTSFLSLAAGPVGVFLKETDLRNSYRLATIKSMRNYLDKNADNLADIYRYVDDYLLTYRWSSKGQDKFSNYGLMHLEDFLVQLNLDKNISQQQRDEIITLLETLGITRSNAQLIHTVLHSKNILDKNAAIRDIISNTSYQHLGTEKFKFTESSYRKMTNDIVNKTERKMGSELDDVFRNQIAKHNADTYGRYAYNPIKTISKAVKNIEANEDVERSMSFIRQVIREQDWPENFSIYSSYLKFESLAKKGSKEAFEEQGFPILIEDVKYFLSKTDDIFGDLKDTSKAFKIPDWYKSLLDLYKVLDKRISDISFTGGAAAVELVKNLEDLRKALKAFTTDEFVEDVVNYVENIDNEAYVALSHFGAFRTMNDFTNLAKRADYRNVFNHLADESSLIRGTYIPNMIRYFNENDLPQYAKDLNIVLSQVDTTNNLLKELSTELALEYKLSKSTNDQLNNIWYDVIEDNKNIMITDILNEDKLDIDQIRYKSYSAFKKGYKETYRTMLMHKMGMHIDRTKELTEKLMKEVPDVPIEKIKKDIKDQLYAKLNRYINSQAEIGTKLGIDNITLTSTYNESTIGLVKNLSSISNRFNLGRAPKSNKISKKLTTELLNEYDTTMLELNMFGKAIGEGLATIKHKGEVLKIPLEYNEAIKYLKQVNEQYNFYSASIETNLYTMKYIEARSPSKDIFKLTPQTIKGTNSEYSMLTHTLRSYSDILHEDYKYELGYINGLRETLIATYSRPNALYRPVNPQEYFNSLSPQALLGWETLSKSSLSINNRNAFETNARKLLQQQGYFNRLTKSDQLAKLTEVYRNSPNIKDNTFIELSKIARDLDVLHYANRYVDASLTMPLHSLEDLGTYQSEIEQYFADDVKAADDIFESILNIENSKEIVDDFDNLGSIQNLRDFANADYGYEIGLNKPQIRAFQERESSKAIWISQMDAEELATHIANACDGWLVFRNSNIKLVKHLDGSMSFEPLDNIFNFSKKELEDAGLKMMKYTDGDGVDWYHFRLTDLREHTKFAKNPKLLTSNQALQEGITNLISKYRARLNLIKPDYIPDTLITTQTLNQDTAERFLEEFKDFYGDFEERKLYQKYTKSGLSKFYDKSFERLNFSVVGGYDVYNVWNSLYSDDFIPHSIELSRNTFAGLLASLNRSNKVTKWLTLFFNKDWSLSESEMLKEMFSEASSKRIKEFFATGDYRVLILRKDTKGLPKVYEYKVWNKHTLAEAAQAGGILVPRETYGAMKQVINKREITNSLLDIYRRVIPTTYKSMYLFTPGFLFRNFLDTLGYKNMNETGLDILKYYIPAYKALDLHNKIQQEVLDLAENKTFSKEKLLEVLKKHTKEEADIYFLTDIFVTSSASGGLSNSLGKFLEEYNKQNIEDLRPYWERIYEDKVLFGDQPWNPLSWTRNLNDHIEQTGRFALFLESVNEGLPINTAVSRVIKTHFDYSTQYDLIDYCEMLFWFSTFPINNFNYYVNGGLTRNMQLYRFLLDTQTASWNNGEYTYEELKKTKFLSYHAAVGNLRLGNIIFKTSPSVFDFINLVSDPIGNIEDRLNPFIATVTGMIEKEKIAEELNPLQTQFRNIAKVIQASKGEAGGSWIPSIYSTINDYDYTRAAYRWRNRVRKPSYNSYPKTKKRKLYIAYNKYSKKYFAKRWDPEVRKFMRTYTKYKIPRLYNSVLYSNNYYIS